AHVTAAAVPQPRRRARWRSSGTIGMLLANRQAVIGITILAFFLIVAVIGPFIVGPVDKVGAYKPYLNPSAEHFFGTDQAGRDLFVTNIHAIGVSLIVGVV